MVLYNFKHLAWKTKQLYPKLRTRPSHGVSLRAQHQNRDAHFYLSFSPCPFPYFDPYDGACASYVLYPSLGLCPCAFYASSPCLWTHF